VVIFIRAEYTISKADEKSFIVNELTESLISEMREKAKISGEYLDLLSNLLEDQCIGKPLRDCFLQSKWFEEIENRENLIDIKALINGIEIAKFDEE
jgi:hypothetical protein